VVVTLPSRQTVVELCAGMLRRMGLTDLIARSLDDYVSLAVRLGTNATRRGWVVRQVQSRVSALYEDAGVVDEWAGVLRRLAESAVA
jgi:predicted O-linked N-acetylglucosamine transferase (SPINDLY family)